MTTTTGTDREALRIADRAQCGSRLGCDQPADFVVDRPSGQELRCADHIGHALSTLPVGMMAVVRRLADTDLDDYLAGAR